MNNVDDDLYDIEESFKNPNYKKYSKRTIKRMNRDAQMKSQKAIYSKSFHESKAGLKQKERLKLEKDDYLAMVIAGFQVIGPILLLFGALYFIIFFLIQVMF
jgi:hypothetical protein